MTTKQEHELLLTQLRNTQKELAEYYKINQILKTQIEETKPIVQGVSQLKIDGKFEQDGYQEIRLTVNADIAGMSYDQLQIKLSDNGGVAAFVIREEGNEGVLRWPESLKNEYGNRLIVKAGDVLSVEALKSMSSQDWCFVSGLISSLHNYLFQRSHDFVNEISALGGKVGKSWLAITKELVEFLNELDSEVRWNEVIVRESAISADYERIWFELKDMTFRDEAPVDYNFKLVLSSSGEQEINLIFREQEEGQAPFSSWPPSDSDSFGPLLKLHLDPSVGLIVEEGYPVEMIQSDRVFINSISGKLSSLFEKLPVLSDSQIPKLLNTEVAQVLVRDGVSSEQLNEGGLLSWQSVDLLENYNAGKYVHLGVRFNQLRFEDREWSAYALKVFIRRFSGQELGKAIPGIELRNFDENSKPLLEWPPESAEFDDYGARLRIERINGELNLPEALPDRDKKFLSELFNELPRIISKIGEAESKLNPALSIWCDVFQAKALPVDVQAG